VPDRDAGESKIDKERIERAVREILERSARTPTATAWCARPLELRHMYEEIFAGLHDDPSHHLTVTVRGRPRRDGHGARHRGALESASTISSRSRAAHVAYIPGDDGRITGLSKIARLVDGFAKRPQVQERLTTQIADALVDVLEPDGVLVMIEAEHFCMSMRGVKKPGSLTITSAVRGCSRPTPPPGPRP
jgi:GTP cyclohydrolase I